MSATTLVELAKDKATDKNTVHSYLPTYDAVLSNIQNTATNVLEIGIYDGGSIQMWADYFPNAHVIGMDVSLRAHARTTLSSYIDKGRIEVKIQDAYTQEALKGLGDKRFDLILDDGPHTLPSMLYCATHYSEILSDRGIMIIEDIQDIGWCDKIMQAIPAPLRSMAKVYDQREVKGRYDDIFIVLDKSRAV
jgi:predicted O-methyltransferase YrrM